MSRLERSWRGVEAEVTRLDLLHEADLHDEAADAMVQAALEAERGNPVFAAASRYVARTLRVRALELRVKAGVIGPT